MAVTVVRVVVRNVSSTLMQYLEGKSMFNNVGMIDRLIRLLLAVGLLYLGLNTYANSGLGMGLDIVGAVLALTGLFGTCALYRLFGINTCKTDPTP